MEKIPEINDDIRLIFSNELERYCTHKSLSDRTEEFHSINDILNYLINKYPFRSERIEGLKEKITNQKFEQSQLHQIAVFLDSVIPRNNPIQNYEVYLLALSITPNQIKEELQTRINHIQELQNLLSSYTIESIESAELITTGLIKIETTQVQSVSSKIKQKILSLFTNEKKEEEDSDKRFARPIFFKKIMKKPTEELIINAYYLSQKDFYVWLERRKNLIIKYKELIELLKTPKNRDILFNLIYNTPIFTYIINPHRWKSQEDYQYLINLITEGTNGLLSISDENYTQGAVSLSTNVAGALTQAPDSEN